MFSIKVDDQALFLTHSDVDVTGKSYYGETNLYLVALDGSFDGLVDLGQSCTRLGMEAYSQADKEGPIYDFGWNPNSREFSVCYGCEYKQPPSQPMLMARHAGSSPDV